MTKPRLQPNWTWVADTIGTTAGQFICPLRPVTSLVIDGTRYFANGWNRAWYLDLLAGKLQPLGSVAPTTFVLTIPAGGAAMPTGLTFTYYVVFRNSARGEETAPQVAAAGDVTADPTLTLGVAGKAISNATGITRDVNVAWTDPADGRWTTADIYRRRQNSSEFVRVGSSAIAGGAFLDTIPEASLSTATSDIYVPRYRTTYPPIFKVLSAHLGRILGITGTDALIYYSQATRPDGELVQTDFPSANILAIEPDDGLGVIVALFSHYDTTLVLKERGGYLLEGDPADFSIQYRRMYAGRGISSPRAIVPVQSMYVIHDQEGLYGWSPNGEPAVLGLRNRTIGVSPLAPIWARLNRAAMDMVHLDFDPETGYVHTHMPFDHDPIPKRAPSWNVAENRFDGIDDEVNLAAGLVEDSHGLEHRNFLDDIGFQFERDLLPSYGLEAGTPQGVVASGTGFPTIAVTGTPFATNVLTGPTATPYRRRSAAGALLDENRVLSNVSGDIHPLYWSSSAVAAGQTIDTGVIPFEPVFAQSDYQTDQRKTVMHLTVRFTPQTAFLGVTPTLNVYSSPDAASYTLRRAVNMTGTDGWATVPCWDRCFKWNLKMQADRAGDAVELQALSAWLTATWLRR